MTLKNLIMNCRESKFLNHLLLMNRMCSQEINYNFHPIFRVSISHMVKSFMAHLEYIYLFDISILCIKELNWHIKLVKILIKMKNLKV